MMFGMEKREISVGKKPRTNITARDSKPTI